MPFPSMARFRQRFEVNSIGNVADAVREQLAAAGLKEAIAPGARIAVTGGSRGIDEIDLITRTVIDCIRECGGQPFVLPAMGSHGGARGTERGIVQLRHIPGEHGRARGGHHGGR